LTRCKCWTRIDVERVGGCVDGEMGRMIIAEHRNQTSISLRVVVSVANNNGGGHLFRFGFGGLQPACYAA